MNNAAAAPSHLIETFAGMLVFILLRQLVGILLIYATCEYAGHRHTPYTLVYRYHMVGGESMGSAVYQKYRGFPTVLAFVIAFRSLSGTLELLLTCRMCQPRIPTLMEPGLLSREKTQHLTLRASARVLSSVTFSYGYLPPVAQTHPFVTCYSLGDRLPTPIGVVAFEV